MNREKSERAKLVIQQEAKRKLDELDEQIRNGVITYSSALTIAFGYGIEFDTEIRRVVDQERE